MRVCFLTTSYSPAIGGVERHAQRLAEILAARGCQVTILTGQRDPSRMPEEAIGAVHVYRVPLVGQRLWETWVTLIRYRRLLRDADIIHCHDFSPFLWYLPLRLLWPRKPVFVTFHGWEGRVPPDRITKLVRRFVERMSCGSIAVGQFISKWYGQEPSFVVYGGVDVTSGSVGMKKDERRAVFVGHIREDTGIRLYLDAFQRLVDSQRLARMDVVGDGALRSDFETRVNAHRLPVLFHGFQKDPMHYFVAARYAFVSSYLAMLEAMASEAIVVAVYDNALKEDYLRLSPFAPYIVIVDSVDGVVRTVAELSESPERQKALVARGRRFAEGHSWSKIADSYEELWQCSR